jgi:chaperonin cofactor prefoldin
MHVGTMVRGFNFCGILPPFIVCYNCANREAARECQRKKEYIKCLENRVAVLENQNKTTIEELKKYVDCLENRVAVLKNQNKTPIEELKDYVSCLENRVAVLENQNKTLTEELKSLKQQYCQQETE